MSLRKIQEEEDYAVEISQTNMAKLKEAFERRDKKKLGMIQADEVHELIQETVKDNQDFYSDDVEEALDEMGKTLNDKVSLNELVEIVKRLMNPKGIIDAFRLFDKDKNGYISMDEFRSILKLVNCNFSEEEINEIFVQSDMNKDGMIDYKEFVKYWHSQ